MRTSIDKGTYSQWSMMVKRCHDPAHVGYADYGGRGIQVCPEWRETPQAFFEAMGKRPYYHTIERIDNLRGYEPGNVKWVEVPQQNRNRRDSIKVLYKGKYRCVSDWCELLGLRRAIIVNRIAQEWPVRKVFEEAYQTRPGTTPDPWELTSYPGRKYRMVARMGWRHGYEAGIKGGPADSWHITKAAYCTRQYVDFWKQGYAVGVEVAAIVAKGEVPPLRSLGSLATEQW